MFKYLMALMLCLTFLANGQSVDPTKPLSYQASTGSNKLQIKDYVLQSIIDNGQQKHVVINGKLMVLGDQIGPYQLINITKEHVVLSSTEKELKVSLFSSVVAK